jgi:hypothetical protein
MNELTKPVTRESILALQAAMSESPQYTGEVTHHFAPGLYGRELFIQAGSLIVGKLHRHSHLISLIEGTCTISSEFDRETIEAPRVWLSVAGIKRAIYAHTDSRIVTYHPTESTNLQEIEDEVIAPDYDNLLE